MNLKKNVIPFFQREYKNYSSLVNVSKMLGE